MRTKAIFYTAVILITAFFLHVVEYKNARHRPADLRDAVKDDGAFGQLLSAVSAASDMDVPAVALSPAQAPATLLQGPDLLAALHKQTTLNGGFKARTYPEAKFFMYSRADVIEKNGMRGIMEIYSQTFMEGVAGADGCHVECADANGDGRINFDDYMKADRDRCMKDEFIPSGIYPIARCKTGTADFNNDGKQGDFVNTEHLWPKARFGKQADMVGDLHNLLPAFAVPNSKRGDTPYGSRGFMPPKEVRGQIARAMFYFATTYYDRIAERYGQEFFLGMIPALMEWNRSFPPGEAEMKRNGLVSGFQGNRNPYIDNPALADQVGQAAWSNIFR
ncbi:MAG: endonuclease [bacterium]